MTVGANVKASYFTVKSAKASLEQLELKTNNPDSKQVFQEAKQILSEVTNDLKKQVQFLAREESQYQ